MCVQVYVYGCQRLALSIFFNYSLHYLLRKCLSQEPAACWSASLDRDPVSASCAMYDYMIIERLPWSPGIFVGAGGLSDLMETKQEGAMRLKAGRRGRGEKLMEGYGEGKEWVLVIYCTYRS